MATDAQWSRFVEDVPWELDLLEDVRRVREGAIVEMLRRWGPWWLTLRSSHAELENWMLGDEAWQLPLDTLDRKLRERTKSCSRCGEPCRAPMRVEEPLNGTGWVPLCRACERRRQARGALAGARSQRGRKPE
jgi:hypothetical protein